jgi:transposase
MRDLDRTRDAAVNDLRAKRQRVTSFLLRYGRSYPGKKTWGARHDPWLAEQKLEHLAQRIAFEETVMAARQSKERLERLEAAIVKLMPQWSLGARGGGHAGDAGCGHRLHSDFAGSGRRPVPFRQSPAINVVSRLVPSERSTGDSIRRGPSTTSPSPNSPASLVTPR